MLVNTKKPKLRILGIRGIPAKHGGFETFAERLALYLVGRGWKVSVYNQEVGNGEYFYDDWYGIERIHIPVTHTGAKGTVVFDWKSIIHASRYDDLVLTLGYNTAVFEFLFRLKGVPNIVNMDGLEWRRGKWKWYEKIWLYVNERVACRLANHLIADHPRIKSHLESRVSKEKITMIPYGGQLVVTADRGLVEVLGLEAREYALVIARPEPENTVLEIVSAFSRKNRGKKLVVLGNFDALRNGYHKQILAKASSEVIFPGAIYDKLKINALRYYSRLYIHGHTVGGTNPSLVEALGAGTPVLAHRNEFNKWVAGDGAQYFTTESDCSRLIDTILDDDTILSNMSIASRSRFETSFRWDEILGNYERVLTKWTNSGGMC